MWEKIKNILLREGGKCIIVEDNQPTYIVMKLEDYDIDEVNRNIDHWKQEENTQNEPEIKEDEKKEDVKIEDLPF
ncbi:hypothetical protein KKH07_00735 [Patescibacteria group bacterium]|nr:hypothetical protein [Patescibacteria group bacterium]MBU1563869.1 hypothetical protein [Patescibacteria group bacterium]MBU2068344.1 hypothetical protein [Patescibacteria group bacterium]